jgi:hypothetical protein
MPVNGRDFANLALPTPGVTRDVRGGLSFAGQRASLRVPLLPQPYERLDAAAVVGHTLR